MSFSRPELLGAQHNLDDFDSGNASLDEWLRVRALSNQISGASRTFVAMKEHSVLGYYSLASASISNLEATGSFRRNMPDPIPVVLLARLAVAKEHQGRGIGRALIRDASARVLAAAETIGIRGVVIHAISEQAKQFYLALGFKPSVLRPLTLMISLRDLRHNFRG